MGFGQQATSLPRVDPGEAGKAFALLNKIRSAPVNYAVELDYRRYQAGPRPALLWNDTLARIAERKAMDMATNDYFAHVDPHGFGMNHYIDEGGYRIAIQWLINPKENGFESLQGGADDGELAIKDLIMDINVPSKGHRKHLLGVGEWNASLIDVGIGFVHSTSKTEYRTYTCVLIAKHK